ncbi:MAG: accessory factor UbiK family protein [Pseudomonadota bacterium]
MQTQSPLFDEIAKLMSEAAGAVDGVRREAEAVARGQLQRLLSDMDLGPREEFEAVRDMAAAARVENERLAARIGEIEGKIEAGLGKTS